MQNKLYQRKREEIDHGGGNGKEGGVEAVEHAAVTGKDVATVLYAKGALEKTFHEVAPCAEYYNSKSKTYPLEN